MSLSPFLTMPSLVLLPAVPGVQRPQGAVFAHVEQHANCNLNQIALHDPVADTRFDAAQHIRLPILEVCHVSR